MGMLIFYQVTEFMSFQKTSEMLIDNLQEDQFVSALMATLRYTFKHFDTPLYVTRLQTAHALPLLSVQFNLNIDLILPRAPCAVLSLDIVDVTGVHEVGIEGRLHKHSLDENGKVKGVTDAVSFYPFPSIVMNVFSIYS